MKRALCWCTTERFPVIATIAIDTPNSRSAEQEQARRRGAARRPLAGGRTVQLQDSIHFCHCGYSCSSAVPAAADSACRDGAWRRRDGTRL